ncbi:MAG: dephospho-CoA kinase [Oceanococcus sp.]
MSLCVGLTGGIASGKSTVAGLFVGHGVPVVDADQTARDVVAPGSVGLQAVIEHFGENFLSDEGTLNRRMMREAVFSEPEKRAKLEGILHPLIRQSLQKWREDLSSGYGILMAPIMRQGGFDKMTDRMLVVDVSRDTQKQRLMQRDDINATLAEQMLNAQSSRSERLAMADDVIDNSAAPQALQAQVTQLHHRYLKLAQD